MTCSDVFQERKQEYQSSDEWKEIFQTWYMFKKVHSQSKKHHFEESGCEEEFNSLFPWKSNSKIYQKLKRKN